MTFPEPPTRPGSRGSARRASGGVQRVVIDQHDVTVLLGDVREQLATLPDDSVNCIMTSPPYFGLRDYGVDGQLGLEATPAEYIAAMLEVFREARRVLRSDGVLWLNIGDSYSGKGNAGASAGPSAGHGRPRVIPPRRNTTSHTPYKGLHLIPQRVAIALSDDGWTIRSEVIWAKRNMMPERVDDRPTKAHEQVWLATKNPRYWYDADAIRDDSDPKQEAHNNMYARVYSVHSERAATTGQPGNVNNVGIHSRPGKPGRNARTVWSISAQPFPGAHFACMPPELARRCILAGCPTGGVVLDPFAGSGTTLMVARQLGRRSVGIELNPAYIDIIRDRIGPEPFDFGTTA